MSKCYTECAKSLHSKLILENPACLQWQAPVLKSISFKKEKKETRELGEGLGVCWREGMLFTRSLISYKKGLRKAWRCSIKTNKVQHQSKQHLLENTGSSQGTGGNSAREGQCSLGCSNKRTASSPKDITTALVSTSFELKNCLHFEASQDKPDEVQQVQQRTVTTARGWSRLQTGVSASRTKSTQTLSLSISCGSHRPPSQVSCRCKDKEAMDTSGTRNIPAWNKEKHPSQWGQSILRDFQTLSGPGS